VIGTSTAATIARVTKNGAVYPMKMSSAASILMNPFQPVLNALPIDGVEDDFAATAAFAAGSGLSLSCTRRVASETRSSMARFIA
jgi:hypothetical protein